MSDDSLSSDLSAFAAQLSGLHPVAAQVDRDQVMFAAGARSQQRRTRRAVCTSAALGLSIAALGVVLPQAFRPDTRVIERIVYRGAPANVNADSSGAGTIELPLLAPVDHPRPLSAQSNFQLRRIALLHGVDALPDGHHGRSQSGGDHRPTSRQELLDELLGS